MEHLERVRNNAHSVGEEVVEIVTRVSSRHSRTIIVQNTGAANIRIGGSQLTSVNGVRLEPGDTMVLNREEMHTQSIFAVREGEMNSIVAVQVTT